MKNEMYGHILRGSMPLKDDTYYRLSGKDFGISTLEREATQGSPTVVLPI
ncbi:hypothetical protein MTBBW1_1230028 [Desulfamplus magnetovallimortis]|uniref:Uncharacterized protein n=1 Tax=Desulfamplus magnetovallimortis TaxID=1246637 RepID=A0A1W1H6H5_9BACT|nr:hypothetical protein MTBBW1_1230028 [Desulfamplus magnetovallimortis]